MPEPATAIATPVHNVPGALKLSGDKLLQVAMPIGGIGAGCVCFNGSGGLQDFAVHNVPATTALPDGHGFIDGAFALLAIRGSKPVTKLIEGPICPEKIYDQSLQAQGYRKVGHEGFPRFDHCEFRAQYPFGEVTLTDSEVPLSVRVTGWNPFIPRDDIASSLPCAILEYSFHNESTESVSFDFVFSASHIAVGASGLKGTRNALLPERDGILFSNTDSRYGEKFGTAAIVAVGRKPRIKAAWFRGGWFDSLSILWREVDGDRFTENDGAAAEGRDGRSGGSLLISETLAPGESVTIPIVYAWHFPNANLSVGAMTPATAAATGASVEIAPLWRPFYAGQWTDAAAVAYYSSTNYDVLRARTLAFKNALFSSTLPPAALDAVASNLAILKSPTVLRQENGNVWAWEGCFTGSGCCHGSCTHVWNYAQAMPHLFPKLERTLREQELRRSMDERGHVNFRSALPDGPTGHGYHAASDGQLGGIMKLYRDWQIGGDTAWMTKLYPLAKLSLDFCIEAWDPEHRGGLFEPHHNTYDIEFWGPDGMCGSIYAGALAAMALLAQGVGNAADAAHYGELAARAAAFLDSEIFNGEYYIQKVQWEGLREQSFLKSLASGDLGPETQALLAAEGPKYQYGNGCLSDGVIGAWMSTIYGIPTDLDREHVRKALTAIFRYNFKADLFDHCCAQRPGYALGHEAGLIVCTWPGNDKPSLPFVYCDEVFTGIEYQVASHLIAEGLVDEGMTIVEGIRARYEGHVRNPFNEYECGSYYARAMASYALLQSLSGFRYSAVDRALHLAPQLDIRPFRVFFSTESGFGTVALTENHLRIDVIEGELTVNTVKIDGAAEIPWGARIAAGKSAEVGIGR